MPASSTQKNTSRPWPNWYIWLALRLERRTPWYKIPPVTKSLRPCSACENITVLPVNTKITRFSTTSEMLTMNDVATTRTSEMVLVIICIIPGMYGAYVIYFFSNLWYN